VVHEIEFDVASAAVRLECALALAERLRALPLDDRRIRRQKSLAHVAREREARLEIRRVEIVEEYPADAARLVAVAYEKVLVAPPLVFCVGARPVGLHRIATRPMKVPHVLEIGIVRRQVHAAAEPPHRRLTGLLRREEADVHVHRRDVRIARMQDERDAERLVCAAGEARARRRGRSGQGVAANLREADARALEQRAVLEYARHPAAALRTIPPVPPERRAVEGFEAPDDRLLKAGQELRDARGIHAVRYFRAEPPAGAFAAVRDSSAR